MLTWLRAGVRVGAGEAAGTHDHFEGSPAVVLDRQQLCSDERAAGLGEDVQQAVVLEVWRPGAHDVVASDARGRRCGGAIGVDWRCVVLRIRAADQTLAFY